MPTETRTFIGETSTAVGDGYAGFRLNQPYQLTYERRDDGTVAIKLDHHEHVSPSAGPMVVTAEQFEKWFRKG
jgi:hypothetical protein